MPIRLNSFAKSVLSRIRKRSQLRRSFSIESLEPRILLFNGPLMSDELLCSSTEYRSFAAGLASAPVNSTVSQVIYVDFDGAQAVHYHGPIGMEGLEVPAFAAPTGLVGQEELVKASVLNSLNSAFEGTRVSFVATQPMSGIDFSTIYVGGDGSAFSDYGFYYGLAEQVDHGNQHRDDNAFVFSDVVPSNAKDAETYGRDLAKVVAHEAGHLLGIEHPQEEPQSSDPLASVAFKPYTHIEVAVDVRRDLLADGKVTIEGRDYNVHPRVVEAIKQYPAFYYGGAGDDAFPDLVMAQAILHPDSTGVWIGHFLDNAWAVQGGTDYSPAEQLQILAFAYGYATHGAGDVWGHTLANDFTDGVWPDFGNILDRTNETARLNPIRHLILEGYSNDATPGYDGVALVDGSDDETERTRLPNGDVSNDSSAPRDIDSPHRFLFETTIKNLPDLPGHKEDFLAQVTENVASQIADLNLGIFSNSIRSQLQDLVEPQSPVFLSGNVVVTAIPGANAWKVNSDFKELIIRSEVSASGKALLGVYEHVQSRGPVLNFVIDLRNTLVRLRAGETGPASLPNDPFKTEIDRILGATEALASGDDIDTDGLFDDVKALSETIIDVFKELFSELSKGNKPSDEAFLSLAAAFASAGAGNTAGYLEYWIESIDTTLQNWNRLGQAFTKAFFYAQTGRDLQNQEGLISGIDAVTPDFPDERGELESDVKVFDRFLNELEDPNGDGATNDSFLNQFFIPMLGMPRSFGDLREGLQNFGDELDDKFLKPLDELIGDVPNPLSPLVDLVKEIVVDYLKNFAEDIIKKAFGVNIDFQLIEFIFNVGPSSLMGVKSITINGNTLPLFKETDQARLNEYLGFVGTDYNVPIDQEEFNDLLAKSDVKGVTFEFYPNARGRLKANAEYDKEKFAPFANAVTTGKILLLQENLVNETPVGGLQPKTLSKLFTDLTGRDYDFAKMNLNGNHGGNIMTATMPNVLDPFGQSTSALDQYPSPVSSDLWLTLIDADHQWRQDGRYALQDQFRFHETGVGDNATEWLFSGLTPGATYKLQTDWLVNEFLTDQGRSPTSRAARYEVFTGGSFLKSIDINQGSFADDEIVIPADPNSFEASGQAWENLGTFTVGPAGSLRVRLGNVDRAANFNAVNIVGGLINAGDTGLETGQRVVYHKGTGSSGNLVDKGVYYVIAVDATHIQLAATLTDATRTDNAVIPNPTPIPLSLGAITGSNHFLSVGAFVVAGRARLVPISVPGPAKIVTNKDSGYSEVAPNQFSMIASGETLLNNRVVPQSVLDTMVAQFDESDSFFSERDFNDIEGLVQKLVPFPLDPTDTLPADIQDPVSAFLWRELSTANQQLLIDFLNEQAEESDVVAALVDKFNALLRGPSLFNPPLDSSRFDDVTLLAETGSLLSTGNPIGERLVRLNRLLLEDAYRHEIARSLKNSFVVQVVTPSVEWRLIRLDKVDAEDGNKVVYGEQYRIVKERLNFDISQQWRGTAYPTGKGNFPLWESNLLRPAFRVLFTDWQNGTNFPADNFPDLGDATTPDPNFATTPGSLAFGRFPAYVPFRPTLVAPTTGTLVVDGDDVLNLVGKLTFNSIVGNGDASVDSLVLHVIGDVILKGFVGGGGLKNITITATGSITVADGATVSSRQVGLNANHWDAVSLASSGNISFEASIIEVGLGANILAHATAGFAPGNVSLTADDQFDDLGNAFSIPNYKTIETEAAIDLAMDARVTGGNVTLQTTAVTKKKPELDVDFSTPTRAVKLADVDGDGDNDLIVGTQQGGVLIYKNVQGKFEDTPLAIEIDPQFVTTSLAVGDVDGDSDIDIVAGNRGQPTRMYLNNSIAGVGTFAPGLFAVGVNVGTARDTMALALGNLDADTALELVVGTDGGGLFVHQFGAGTFNSGASIQGVGFNTSSLALGDVDNDGDLDLVAGNRGQANRYYRNTAGSLAFAASVGAALNTTAVALGNLDGDATLELVVGTDGNGLLLHQFSAGAFGAATVIDGTSRATTSLAVGDLDLDGQRDLVVGNLDQANLMYLNTGNSIFAAAREITSDINPTRAIVVGEVGGDDDGLDVVAGNYLKPGRLYQWENFSWEFTKDNITSNFTADGYRIGTDIGVESEVVDDAKLIVPLNISTDAAIFVSAESAATIHLGAGVLINASGNVNLNSNATAIVDITTQKSGFGITFGNTSPTAEMTIAAGATINAMGDLHIASLANNDLRVTSFIPGVGVSSNVSFGLASAHSNSLADIQNGAIINVGNSADVRAENQNKFRNTASAIGFGTAADSEKAIGASVALSFFQSNAKASVSGIVTTGGNLDVHSSSINDINVTRTFAHVGSGSSQQEEKEKGGIKETVKGLLWDQVVAFIDAHVPLSEEIGDIKNEIEQYNVDFQSGKPNDQYAGAIALVTSDNNATAVIGNEAWVTVGGSLTVKSEAEDPFQVSASGNAGALRPAGEQSVGGALVYSKAANQANAFIAWNATVDVRNVLEVHSVANFISPVDPLQLALAIGGFGDAAQTEAIGGAFAYASAFSSDEDADEPSSLQQQLEQPTNNLLDHILDEEEIGTSFIHAGGSVAGGGTAVAGGINLMFIYNSSDAGIASQARINQRSAQLWTGPVRTVLQDVLVKAESSMDVVNYAGNPTVLNVVKDEAKTAVGGFVDLIFTQNFANAHIDDLAIVSADRDVEVTATTDVDLTTVVMAGSVSKKIGVDGAVISDRVRNQTRAYIEDRAVVDADRNVRLDAQSDVNVVSIAPAIAISGQTGVGIGAALNEIRDRTQAFIGDSQEDVAPGGYGGELGSVHAGGDLSLYARSNPQAWSIAASTGVATGTDNGGSSSTSNVDLGSGSASSFGLGLSGSMGLNWVDQLAETFIRDSVAVTVGGDLSLEAESSPKLISGAGAFAFADGHFGIGGTYSHNQLIQATRSYTEQADIQAGAVGLNAHSNNTILGIAASGAGAKGNPAIAGGANLNRINEQTLAYLGDGTTLDATNVSVLSNNTNHFIPIAGAIGISGGGSFSVGANGALVFADTDVGAWIGAADKTFDPTDFALLADNKIVDENRIKLTDHHLSTGQQVVYRNGGGESIGGLSDGTTYFVIRMDASHISLASTGVNAKKGIAIELDDSTADGTNHRLEISSSTEVTANGDIDVLTENDVDLIAVSASLSVAPSGGGFAGSASIMNLDQSVEAYFSAGSHVNANGSVHLNADDDTKAVVVAGSAGGGGNAGAGLSLANLKLDRSTLAYVGHDAIVTSGGLAGLKIEATNNGSIFTFAAGGAGAGTGANAIAGTATLTRNHENTLAYIDENATITVHSASSPGLSSVSVTAEDNTILNNAAGVAVVGGKRGFGGSVDATKVEKSTRAFVGGGTHISADGNVKVSANSSEDLLSVAASVGLSGPNGSSILGSLSGYNVEVTTQALLGDNPLDALAPLSPAIVHAAGSVVVTADDKNEMDFIDGGAGVSGGTSLGGAASVAVVRKTTEALIAPNAQVSADALATIDAVSVNNGKFSIANGVFVPGRVIPPSFQGKDSDGDGQNDLSDSSFTQPRLVTAITENRRGVVVTATNRDDVAAFVVGGGFGNGFTFGISTPAAILRVDTTARIGENAQVNAGNQATAGSNQSVLVAAASDYSHLALSGALAASSAAAVAPSGNIESTRMNTTAAIGDNAVVKSRQDVTVQSTATEDSLLVTASGSLSGTGGGNGSVAVFALNNSTKAFIGAGAQVNAEGNVMVSASDVTDLDAIAGAAAISGGAGVSLSLGVNVIHKDTQAFIANDAIVDAKANSTDVFVLEDVGRVGITTTTTRGVVVQARSKESLLDIAASGGVGGAFSGAGSVNANVIDSDTSAHIGDSAHINSGKNGINPLQSVHVIAGNEVDVRSIVGGVAVGSASLAGAVDIGVVRNDTTSFIGSNANVRAADDIVVNSLERESIDSLGVSGGFAATGTFAASVAVWALGTNFDATYSDDTSTANSLSHAGSTIDQQAASNVSIVNSILSQRLNNFSGVSHPTGVSTPSSQIADILREGKNSIDHDVLTGSHFTTDLFDAGDATGTVAEVRSGAVLSAGDDIKVNANSQVDLNSFAGAFAGAVAFAAGAAVDVERVHVKTDSLFAGIVANADQVSVQSNFSNATLGRSLSGQGSIGAALGASVTSIRDDSSTTARMDGERDSIAQIHQARAVTVNASSVTSLDGRSGGGAFAVGGALGVTVSKVVANGSTAALVGDDVQIGGQTGKTVGSLALVADANTSAMANAKAIAAGVGLGSTLNFATAEATPSIDASLGSRVSVAGSQIKVLGNADVSALSTSKANADMLGIQLAVGAALGIGRAKATIAPEIEASIGRNTQVDAGGSVNILAKNNEATSQGALSKAEAGAGAIIAGNTARAFSESSANVDSIVYDGAAITAVGAVTVVTRSDNKAESIGGSLTVGVAGAGGVQTTADVAGIAHADIKSNTTITAASLDVRTFANDRAISEGRAATGGILSGNATTSDATIKQGSTTFHGNQSLQPNSSVSVLGSNINVTGVVKIIADHEADADAFARGTSIGALFAAGKSEANVVVTPAVKADVDSTSIVAGGLVEISTNFGDGNTTSFVARNIDETEAIAADEVSTAYAKGSGGALIGVVGSDASSIYKPKVQTEVGSAVSLTALNITIRSEADSGTAAVATNVAVGFVAVGKANTTVDMKNTVSAEVVGGPELSETHINTPNDFTLRVDSSQKGDAFSHSRAVAGVSIGDANSTIQGDYDLKSSVGQNVDITAGGIIHVESEIDDAVFGSRQGNDPQNVDEFFGANAQADTGGIVADAQANSKTKLGTATSPAQSLVSVGSFSILRAPNVELISDVTDINVKSDANARAKGVGVFVKSDSTGELHSDSKVKLSGGSVIDATTTTIESLQGTGSELKMQVESTSDKDGLFGNPTANVTITQDSLSKIEALDGSSIRTRNLTVRADTDVTQFEATALVNGLVRDGFGTITPSFDRDRNIVWNADVYLKGAPSPKLVIEANGATGATVTEAIGVTIVDTDGNPANPFDTGTIGNVAAPTIVVNSINNTSAFGNVLFEIPLINVGEDASMTGSTGSFTVDRALDGILIQNISNKPLQIGNINVIHLGTPTVVIDVPLSSSLSFDVFQDFGDTNLIVKNASRSGTPSITLSGVINNPVGETTVDSVGGILRTGTGKIVTNVASLIADEGSIGTTATRIPIELIVSDGRQEDLNVRASGSIALDLLARIRQPSTSTPVSIDASNLVATSSSTNLLLHTSLEETQAPATLPLLRVNEIMQNDITLVVSHFENDVANPPFDRGALGTSTTPTTVVSFWNFDLIKGSSIVVSLPAVELTAANVGVSANTDVGGGTIDVAINGDVTLSETTGPMRIGAVATTRGNATLNSNNSIIDALSDATADVVGAIVSLNAATTLGTATVAIDVDSTSRLNATSSGDVFLVETVGNMNLGLVSSSGGNVKLSATAGSILEAASDPEADVVGNSITLTANSATVNPASTIGTTTDALEVNSAFSAAGIVRAISRGSLFLSETAGGMTLAEARSATGNIRVDVPDTVLAGSDLILAAAQVIATAGTVQLNVGDNFSSSAGTVVQGTAVGVATDFGNADPGVGSSITAAGTFTGRPITFSTGIDADTISLSQTTLQGPTTVNASSGSDIINVDRIAPLTTTVSGVRDRLTLNIGSGANQVNATATPTGDYAADIVGGVRGSGINILTVNGTSGNDSMLLTQSQFTVVHAGSPTTVELFTLGNSVDQVSALGGDGNDSLGIDLASGNLAFQNGVAFIGGNGADSVLVSGSTSADTFEIDATSATSGSIRTQVAAGPFSAPSTLTGVEQVSVNGLAPTTTPGDTLRILDSFVGLPVVPNGSFTTPLPVTYTNIEQLVLGSLPVAVNDQVTTNEDIAIAFNPFANDSGLTDLPLTVVFVQSANGIVVYRDNGTPAILSDDTFLFTPGANFSGNAQFQYTVRDANNDQSTATVSVAVSPVTDAPVVSAANIVGLEGTPIQLAVSANLVDTDGSETLDILLHNVPSIASFVNASNVPIGVDLGGGNWRINPRDLSKLFIVVRDNGKFDLILEAIATETASRVSVAQSTTFTVEVQNAAPQATIMTAPDKGTPGEPVSVQMAATDKSSVDQASGFRYRINWGDGSAPEIVEGIVTPTLNHVYAISGNYTITVAATDKDGAEGAIATHRIRISRTGLVADPLNPGRTMLIVEGTSQNDTIEIDTREIGRNEVLDLYMNGIRTETFAMPTSRILVYGQAGNDTIRVDEDVELDTWLFGGFGDDTLVGGSGNSILVGGPGDDALRGRCGEDILIGGRDRDLLFGGDDDNILIAGYSDLENNEAMLLDIQREWTSNDSIKNRIEHLRGVKSGGLNGSTLLRSESNSRNTFDDAAEDRLLNDKNHDWIFVNSDVGMLDIFGQAKNQDELDPISTGATAGFRLSAAESLEVAPLGESMNETTKGMPVFAKEFVLDTNGDGSISPLDVLTIINYINQNRGGQGVDPEREDSQFNDFLDANTDGLVSPLDVLTLINYLNLRANVGEGESGLSNSNFDAVKLPSFGVSEEELLRTKKRLGR